VHVVHNAMGLKHAAVRARLGAGPAAAQDLDAAIAALRGCHGQAHGMFSGDEWLAGTDPARGVETCAVVEAMWSLECLLSVFGRVDLADRLETIAYNPLPAAQSPDLWLHQYERAG